MTIMKWINSIMDILKIKWWIKEQITNEWLSKNIGNNKMLKVITLMTTHIMEDLKISLQDIHLIEC
jgi:hypothetical protein